MKENYGTLVTPVELSNTDSSLSWGAQQASAAGPPHPGLPTCCLHYVGFSKQRDSKRNISLFQHQNSPKMSNTILKGFNLSTAQHRGEGDSLLLKNFLAGDSGKRERSVQPSTASASLFPAHICASSAEDTKEWLADKIKAVAGAGVAAVSGGKANIMAPVLKSTSAEYWLDRENRPPVNERGMSFFAAKSRSVAVEMA